MHYALCVCILGIGRPGLGIQHMMGSTVSAFTRKPTWNHYRKQSRQVLIVRNVMRTTKGGEEMGVWDAWGVGCCNGHRTAYRRSPGFFQDTRMERWELGGIGSCFSVSWLLGGLTSSSSPCNLRGGLQGLGWSPGSPQQASFGSEVLTSRPGLWLCHPPAGSDCPLPAPPKQGSSRGLMWPSS